MIQCETVGLTTVSANKSRPVLYFSQSQPWIISSQAITTTLFARLIQAFHYILIDYQGAKLPLKGHSWSWSRYVLSIVHVTSQGTSIRRWLLALLSVRILHMQKSQISRSSNIRRGSQSEPSKHIIAYLIFDLLWKLRRPVDLLS